MSRHNELKAIKALASGNQEVYKTLFMEYFPKVKYFVAHLVKSDALAEDLAQDIFIKIWIHRENLSDVQSFKAYVYRMAKNTVLNLFKHNMVESKYKEHVYQQEQHQFSIEEELYAKEIELLVELTVSNMPDKRRTVYEMSRVEGLKNEEIADQLNLSKKTVENHLNSALKEIRKTISLFTSFFV